MIKKTEEEVEHDLKYSPKKRLSIFRKMPVNKQGLTLLGLSRHIQQDILAKLTDEEINSLIHYLDQNEIISLLRNVSVRRRKNIIKKASEEIKKKVETMLKFNPRTAASMMNLEYIEVNKETSFEELSKLIKKHEKRTGKTPTIIILEGGMLVGELRGHTLALHKGKEKIGKYAKKVPHIMYNKNEKEIIKAFRENPHKKIIVLDDDKSVLGIIYSDDILKLIEKWSADNIRDFAGVRKEENAFDPALLKVKNRYRWLIINLFTAFMAASVVGLFEDTISAFVLLAVYMPIVAGMGGNAGTQTLAVIVRGLTLKEIDPQKAKRVIINEMLAGLINGIIIGILVFIVATLWNQNPLFGLIIGVAMVNNLMIAGFFGAIIPLTMRRLGKDPASSAGIFITTGTDICGFFVFLGLASLLL